MDYLTIGSSPIAEDCAQVGSNNYQKLAMIECKAFIGQLKRHFGEQYGTSLRIKSFPHDFGTYHEVVCYYNEMDEEAIDYAYQLEKECPEYWDVTAKEEIEFQKAKQGLLGDLARVQSIFTVGAVLDHKRNN